MTSSKAPPPAETTTPSACLDAASSPIAEGDASISVSIVFDDAAPALPDPEARRERERRSIVGRMISDRYRIDALIAEGGMGAVYRGEHVHMRKLVAVKVLRPETEGFPELVTRFEREAIAGAHVDHPNVASATDFGKMPDGAYFLVLEFVNGVTLRQRMKASPVAPLEAARITRQLAEALGACHAMGVVHRDVKPRNVMIEARSGRVKLIDFGLAKVPSRPSIAPRAADDEDEDTHRAITLKGIVFGTVAYMAPEAEFGMDAIDHRADLYALGVIFYELLTGKHPFDATELPALFAAQKYLPPPPFRERAPERSLPAALEAVAMRLLAKRPLDRFQSADEVTRAIDAALGASFAADSTFDNASVSVSVREASEPPARASSLMTAPPVGAPSAVAPGELKQRRRIGLWTAGLLGAVALVASSFVPRISLPRRILSGHAAPMFASAGDAAAVRVRSELEAASLSLSAEKRRLREAAEARSFDAGADAILALAAQHGGPAFDGRDVGAAASIALGLTFTESPRAPAVIDALGYRLGADGIDVLYDISSKHGGARAAKKADELLDRRDVRDRASPAVQAALALRDARCDEKPVLFDHVGKDGDERALMLLERLRGSNCNASRCCYVKNRPLDRTIAAMKARLGKG